RKRGAADDCWLPDNESRRFLAGEAAATIRGVSSVGISLHPSRRTFLRSAGVALALPWLESLAAAAPATKIPRRMVCINAPLGLHPAYFFPQKAGKEYEPTPYLDVIKDFRNDFTVISGLPHPD